MPNWLKVVLGGLLLGGGGNLAHAVNCTGAQVTVTTAGANLGTYNPFVVPTPTLATVTVVNNNPVPFSTCLLSLSFLTPTIPAVMTGVPTYSLQYTVEAVGGGATYLYTGGIPAAANRIDFTVPTRGGSVTRTVQVRPLTGQVVGSGAYTDNIITASIFDRTGAIALIDSAPFPVSATVAAVCELNAPTPASLDFTPAIASGRPNPAFVLGSLFTNVRCTAPTIVRLSGVALPRTVPIGPRPGFDNFIDWRATATFGNATATLQTNSASQANSPLKNIVSGATLNGTISVNVNLLAGNIIQAGSYAGTLTVTIDPNL